MYEPEQNQITLSICVLVYNHEQYIDECMESILKQKMNFTYEILIGNDCSTDASIEKLEKYKDIAQIINREENLGLCANMYDLFMRARGKYVIPIAGDDYYASDCALQKMVDCLENHEEYYSAMGGVYFYNVQKKEIRECAHKDYPDGYSIYDYLKGEKSPVPHGMMRNTFYEDRKSNSYLLKGAKNNEEVKMDLYILEKGKKFVLPESVHVYRYIVSEDALNYNSTHSTLQFFQDIYANLMAVQEVFGDKYNLRPLIVRFCNEFCVKLSDNFGNIIKFFKIMRFQDILWLFWYKCYLKLHHYKEPAKWSQKSYYEKRVSK